MRSAFLTLGLLVLVTFAGCIGQNPVQEIPTASDGGLMENQTHDEGSPRAYESYAPPVPPGKYVIEGFSSQPLVPGDLAIREPEIVILSSDVDGVDIAMKIYRPDTDEPVPVILIPSLYFHQFRLDEDPGTECRSDVIPREVASPTGREGSCRLYLPGTIDAFVPHGYAVAFLSVRGSGSSGGCNAYFSPSEVADADQAVTWLASQAWSAGRVASYGMSYPAILSYALAAQGNPALVTIVPANGHDRWRDNLVTDSAVHWIVDGVAGSPATIPQWELGLVQSRSLDVIADTACPEQVTEAIAWEMLLDDPYSDHEGYWRDRDWRDALLADYRGSIFMVSGSKDIDAAYWHPPVSLAPALREAGIDVYMLRGDWWHQLPDSPLVNDGARLNNSAVRWDWNELLLLWFDHELKGDRTVKLWAPAQIQDNLGQWRVERTYPPTDSMPITFDLEEMAATSATGQVLPTSFAARAGWPTDDIVFSMVLQEELRVAGAGTMDIGVEATGPGGLVSVHLIHMETGKIVMEGDLDLEYRDGIENPQPVSSGQRYDVTVPLRMADFVIPAGDTLEVHIVHGSYWKEPIPRQMFPLYIIQEGTLTLPQIHRDGSTFFDLPWE